MVHLADKNKCTGCSACASSCPNGCITMVCDREGFAFPSINNSACLNCELCRKACPVLNVKETNSKNTLAYAAYTMDTDLRMESSSGGIFSEISKEVLKRNGVIYGAAYDKNFRVIHKCVDQYESLDSLRRAKYSQSDLGNCFPEIKKRLEYGQRVLFSGTPCQVAGLQSFLGKYYENLICIDFVCHGVPSPMVWEQYVLYRSNLDSQGSLPQRINLRCKESGWSKYSYSVDFSYENGVRHLCKNSEDEYMKMFVNDYILRKSCGCCQEKGYERKSDITLGDFWGIWDVAPEMDDDKGTSLVLVHSEKGHSMIEQISHRIRIKAVKLNQASQMNMAMIEPIKHQKVRGDILDTILKSGFQPLQTLLQNQTGMKQSIISKTKKIMMNALYIRNK